MRKHIIIIHEIYGITPSLRELKTKLENSNYTVTLPSLYPDKYTGTDSQISYEKFYQQVGIEKARDQISEIIEQSKEDQIILIGFSVGATVAWLQANHPQVCTIIGLYGSKIRDYLTIEPTTPSHLLFCREESFEVEEILPALNTKKLTKAELIPGVHGFYNRRDLYPNEIKKVNMKIFQIIKEV